MHVFVRIQCPNCIIGMRRIYMKEKIVLFCRVVEINPALVIIEFMSGYNKPCLKTIKKKY